MAIIEAERYHDICCGHRVVGQGGKCENLHGHNYRFHFTIESYQEDGVDSVGRVLDFSVIKTILCEWLEEHWDHKMLLWEQDLMYAHVAAVDPTVVRVPFNPTAENLAKHMVEVVAPDLFADAEVDCVLARCKIDETRKCSATYIKD